MTNILLISVKTLKEQYLLDENLDEKYIIANIRKGQDFMIRPLLGDLLYDQLISAVNMGEVTPEFQTLIETYIHPVLSYYTMSELIYNTSWKMKNQLEGSTNMEELYKLSGHYRKDADRYARILKEYLCDSTVLVTDSEGMKEVYKTGLYLD